MSKVAEDARKIIATLANLYKREEAVAEFEILSSGKCVIEQTGIDDWNGCTDIYGLFCSVPIEIYAKYESDLNLIEQNIKKKSESIFRKYDQSWIGEVVISPELSNEIQGKVYSIDNSNLLNSLEQQKGLMISVSTGGPKIQAVNAEYTERQISIRKGLEERGIKYKNPYKDLWAWYGKWSDDSLPTYQSRRLFIADLFDSNIDAIKALKGSSINPIFETPTGWIRVDRGIGEIKLRLAQAATEEQFQAVGLLCRESLISLAQVVFNNDKHQTTDGIKASKTDAKRMLEAYISGELHGKSNDTIRKHAKASLDLANDLIHRRTAGYRLAALCAEATNAVVNIVAIISGRRDPS